MGLQELQNIRNHRDDPKEKKIYRIPKVSTKRQKKMAEDGRPDEVKLDEWFEATRKKLVGVCQCGCGQPSSKKDDTFYRASICHIFPKAYFKSVMCHPLNYVELAFFGGCHTTFDQMGSERWVNLGCWDDIKAKVLAMEPYLTQEEKARKFYQTLIELVNKIA